MNPRPDLEEALRTLLIAEDRGSPCAEQAIVEYVGSHPSAAVTLADAEYTLGLRYLSGEGISCDSALARRHFENAAVFGYPFPEALRPVRS